MSDMDAEGETISWRDRCIEKFDLKPVPEQWQDQVAKGCEETWKNYYNFRQSTSRESREQRHALYDDEGEGYLLKKWMRKLRGLKEEVLSDEAAWKWPSTCVAGSVCWDDDELRSGEYLGYVWSPYVIPQALSLQHRYHCRPRYSWVEFYSTWAYSKLEFEDVSDMGNRFTELCSNCFEDEELRADVIETSNLNMRTLDRLRKHLFGSCKEVAKKETCDDFSFLQLLFGSMGTFNFQTMKGDIGYSWKPWRDPKASSKLVEEGVATKKGDLYELNTTWLEYRAREVTGCLRPSDKYYKHPTIEDAFGYDSSNDDHEGLAFY